MTKVELIITDSGFGFHSMNKMIRAIFISAPIRKISFRLVYFTTAPKLTEQTASQTPKVMRT